MPVAEMFQEALRAQQANRLAEAESLYAAIVALEPRHSDALGFLGIIAHQLGRNRAAVEYLTRAMAINSSVAHYHTFLAAAYRQLERIGDAIPHYRKSLELNPNQPGLSHNLGLALKERGNLAEAYGCFSRAVELDNGSIDSYYQLAECRGYGHGDPYFATVEAVLKRPGLTPSDQAAMHFALAKMHDDCDEFEEAFAHARIANELDPAEFDIGRNEKMASGLKSVFTEAFFAKRTGFGSPSDLPIFIVGLPRAGKSLTEHILSHYPSVIGVGERGDIRDIARSLPALLKSPLPYPECVTLLNRKMASRIAQDYIAKVRETTRGRAGRSAGGGEARHTVDTTPPNFLRLGLIALLFPKARIIHCRRDPLAQGLACYFRHVNEAQRYAGDLTHFGQYFRVYEDLMSYWRRVLPVPVLDVQYETLVAEPEAQARRIVEFCGMEWDADCLARPYRSSPVQVNENETGTIIDRQVSRWRHYEQFLGPLKAALAGRMMIDGISGDT
jgi:tetratricopeptide (TPR) repeat protein